MSIKCFLEMRRALILNPATAFTQKGLKPSHEWRIDFRCHYPRLQLTDPFRDQGGRLYPQAQARAALYYEQDSGGCLPGKRGNYHQVLPLCGCASFNDFKVRAAQAISSDSTSGPASGYDLYGDIQLEDSLEQKCQKLYRVGTQALQQTLDLLDYGAVRKVVDCSMRRIMCTASARATLPS